MTKQITPKQIRRRLSRLYNLSVDISEEDELENKRYALALIAGVEFRKIAEALVSSRYNLLQVRQERIIIDTFLSYTCNHRGVFYLATRTPLEIGKLAEDLGIEAYKFKKHKPELDGSGLNPYISCDRDNDLRQVLIFHENKEPPKNGIARALERLVELTTTYLSSGDNGIRIM